MLQRFPAALQFVVFCAVIAGCTSFERAAAPAAAADTQSTVSLENTYWKLVRLGDQPVVVDEQQREAHIVLQPDQKRVVGSGGCNNMGGSYVAEDGKLRFSQLIRTMMACPKGMEREQAFVSALEKVASWRIEGERLELLDAAGQSVALFESRHMKNE